MTVMATGLTATGMNWLLHSHPFFIQGNAFEHWLLPTLTSFIIGVSLNVLPFGTLWWIGLFISAGILVSIFVAEYASVDTGAPAYALYVRGADELEYQLKNNPVTVKGERRISNASYEAVKVVLEEAASAEAMSLEKGMIVHKIVVDCDHVHMLVSLPTWMSVSSALQYLKGISSYKIFRLHPTFRKRYRKGAFWSPGHFSRSVSNVTESAVEHYIDKHEYPKFLPQEVGRQMPLRFN